MDKYLRKYELAQHLKMSCATIQRRTKEGIIKPVKREHNFVLYDREECEKALLRTDSTNA